MPPTPETSLARPPRTTPPTARSAAFWSRPSSALAPSAESTENSPNRRIAHAPKEMGDHALNMTAGKFSDWNSMCQKRSGCPRSTVRSRPEKIAPRSEEHTSELQSLAYLVCRLLLEKKNKRKHQFSTDEDQSTF